MSLRPRLLSWQYANYASSHADCVNLLIHLVSVPLFWAGLGLLCLPLAGFSLWYGPLAVGVIALVLLAQSIGHRRESAAPLPFSDPLDAVSRLLIEQLITFPRYLASRGFRCAPKGLPLASGRHGHD